MTTDWVVTMITPVEKVTKMYKEDVLKAYDNTTDSSDQQSEVGLTD